MLEIIMRELSELIPYARNPRNNDAAVERMAASIQEFGFRIPVIVRSDGSIVDGHLRVKAAHRLNIKSVPTMSADDMTDAQIKAFRIMVNKSATWAGWNMELLRLELEDLREFEVDLEVTGFSLAEIDELLQVQNIDFGDAGGSPQTGDTGPGKDDAIRCPKCGCVFHVEAG